MHSINPYWKIALVFKALTDVIILDDFKTCLEKLRVKLVDNQIPTLSQPPPPPPPPPVPPKDIKIIAKSSTVTFTTAQSSPTLVTGPTPKVSPRVGMAQNSDGLRVQRTISVHDTLGHIGTRLSPLPSMSQMREDISLYEKSPSSGGPQMIHVKMDLGLNKFVSSVVGRRPPSANVESPLDPTWPKSGGLVQGIINLEQWCSEQ